MKKIFLSISLLLVISSCAITSNEVTVGFISDIKDRAPLNVVDNSINASKKGEACVFSYVGLITKGDSSIETAKEKGQIKKISHIDRSFKGIGFIYQKGCTIVHGN